MTPNVARCTSLFVILTKNDDIECKRRCAALVLQRQFVLARVCSLHILEHHGSGVLFLRRPGPGDVSYVAVVEHQRYVRLWVCCEGDVHRCWTSSLHGQCLIESLILGDLRSSWNGERMVSIQRRSINTFPNSSTPILRWYSNYCCHPSILLHFTDTVLDVLKVKLYPNCLRVRSSLQFYAGLSLLGIHYHTYPPERLISFILHVDF